MSFYLLENEKYNSLVYNGDLVIRTVNPSEFKLNDYVTFVRKHSKYVPSESIEAKVMSINKSNYYYNILFKI